MILTPLYSQPSITWSKIYSPSVSADEALCICNSGFGFYFAGGHAHDNAFINQGYLMKINEYGDTLWSKFIPELRVIWAITTTSDKGCVVTGDSDSLRVIRLDSNGTILWSKNFMQDYEIPRIRDIKKTPDGSFIACGYRDYQQDGIIIKFNESGDLSWLKIYPASISKIFLSIDISTTGFVVTGAVEDFDTTKTLLLKLNDSGNVEWEKQYKISNQWAYGAYIKKTNKGYLITGGTTDTIASSNYNWMYFMKTDTNGSLLFSKLFAFYKNDDYMGAQYINENRYIFSSFCWNENINDTSYGKVQLTDSLGNILHVRKFYSNTYIIFRSVVKANNNDIILAGITTLLNIDFVLCRVDSSLQGGTIGVKISNNKIPKDYTLYQNYPNPFNPKTIIKFQIPNHAMVELKVYDVLGREITVLINQRLNPGTYEVEFDGSIYPSGVYFYRLAAGEYSECKKMVLIK